MKQQLYLDLARTKAICLAEGVGRYSYCSCLVGRVARAIGCTDVEAHSLNMPPLDTPLWGRFKTVIYALAAEVPGYDGASPHGFLLTWNDTMDPASLSSEVIALIDRAAARASS